MIRILFTGVGRRVELIQAFRSAAEKLGCPLFIYGADSSDTAPVLEFCDYRRRICLMKNPNYIPSLLHLCEHDKIDLVIPTIDTDLLALAEHKSEFQKKGIRVLISDKEKIAVCRDKLLTADFFMSCGLESPKPVAGYKEYQGEFPCFIKPKDGSSSINAFRADNQRELEVYAGQIYDYMVQPFIEGTEYTVDITCDFNGNPVYIVPRERLAVRSGEVLKTKITLDEKIIGECRKVVDNFHPCGPLTVQLIRQKGTGKDYYIEINPRFGGGAPLSIKAGADSAEAIIRLLMGEQVKEHTYAVKDGLVYSRFDQSVCVNEAGIERVRAVIFDLDDTLYSEKEYVKGGYSAVAEYLKEIPGAEGKLWEAFQQGKPAIDTVLKEAGIYTEEKKKKCLNIYRNYIPDIHLYPEAEKLLNRLRRDGLKIGIITDGRPEGQWNKIRALGIENRVDEIIVTDEIGGPQFRKPNDIAFRIMKEKMGFEYGEMLYVGDNLKKDFQAPRKLGMKYIHYDNPDGLYSRYGCEPESVWDITEINEIITKKLGGGGKICI